MPSRTYMVIDRRHDHSFRVPRPDITVKLGTANACNDCHTDKTPEWADTAIENWFGPDRIGFQKYAEAFHGAWTDPANAEGLEAVVKDSTAPEFIRASALSELAPYVSSANISLAKAGIADPDPMVRIGVLDMLQNVPPAQIWNLVSILLSDPCRGVRIRAADLLAALPTADQPVPDRVQFEKAADLLAALPTADQPVPDRVQFEKAAAEFIAAQRLNAYRPEARSALGAFYAKRTHR